MPRQIATTVENNFRNGLITEASGLNFPENACTDTSNCEFNYDGSVVRRRGFDFEVNYSTKTINRSLSVVNTYLWRNVSGNGDVSVYVVQVGSTLYFYETNGDTLSGGAQSTTVSLSTYAASGAPDTSTQECQFSSGNGLLFVTHPYCDPFRVAYTTSTHTATATIITIKIRDLAGDTADVLAVDSRPTASLAGGGTNATATAVASSGVIQSVTVTNGGSGYASVPTVSVAGGGGSGATFLASLTGGVVTAIYITNGGSGYSSPIVTIAAAAGSPVTVPHRYNLLNQGWNSTNLTTWDSARTDLPSNADVMWSFKDSADAFATSTIANVVNGNSPAPRGHYILTLSNQDRDTASGLTGATATTLSYQRPSTSAFFTGRVFYSGINYVGYNAKIYFSQIIERDEQYAFCYQQNDPTAEDNFDLLASDGGYININDAGTIYKLVSISGALLVFAANGVWMITGSTGLGFTASDYNVARISSVPTISASSFVDVNGAPMWWNLDGIYTVQVSQTGAGPSASVNNLTLSTIKTFYDDILPASKLTAKGFHNKITGEIQWLYREAISSTPTDTYAYDSILVFQSRTNAFYPWAISASTASVNGLVVLDSPSGQLVVNQVIDHNPKDVIDGSGNLVVQYGLSNADIVPTFIYLSSYADSGSYKFTMAKAYNTTFLDWVLYGASVNYTSFFTTGYKLHGGALRDFQANYVKLYSFVDTTQQYTIQGLWDFATDIDTHRWSVAQTISHTVDDYSHQSRRVKIRGHGKALQFKVASVTGKDFSITGWATLESANASP